MTEEVTVDGSSLCVYLISSIAITAVLINDAISLVFECPIFSGVMHTSCSSYLTQ